MDDGRNTLSSLLALVAVLAPFSLVAIGGGPAIFAPLQHQAVDVYRWISARDFIELFAIARVSPGPGSMLATLIGYKVAGWSGALVATLAIFVPSSIVCVIVMRVWARYRGHPWHRAFEDGLAPIGAGLMFAGAIAIFKLANAGPLAWSIGGIVAAILTLRPKTHPFLMLGFGAAVFAAASLIP